MRSRTSASKRSNSTKLAVRLSGKSSSVEFEAFVLLWMTGAQEIKQLGVLWNGVDFAKVREQKIT
jgi:hypothetical protein